MSNFKLLTGFFLLIFLRFSDLTAQNRALEADLNLDFVKTSLQGEIAVLIEETGIPSISIALIKEDSIVWAEAIGYCNEKKQVPATVSTIYNAGSTFKMITATAIMQLMESGKLNIDDPVSNYIDGLYSNEQSHNDTNVTIRHLLSHHSGLMGKVETVPLWERKLPKSLDELLDDISIEEAPGIQFKYCNHCYALLGLVIEKVSGMSYQDYLTEHIFKPLQISTNKPFEPSPEMVEELALPYKLRNKKAVPEYQKRFNVFPAGDAYLKCTDMANFLITQLNNGRYNGKLLLKPESIELMHKPQFGTAYYGLGIGIKQTSGEKFLQHAGGVPGFSSFFRISKESKTGVYIMSNASGQHQVLTALAAYSLKLLNGEKKPEPLPSFVTNEFEVIQLPEETLRQYVGKYKLKSNYFISLSLEDSKLIGQATGQEQFQLLPYKQGQFFIKDGYIKIDFNVENDEVKSLSIFDLEGKRVAIKIA